MTNDIPAVLKKWQPMLIAVSLLLLVYGVMGSSRITASSDSRFVLYETISLLHEGNCDLNEYANLTYFGFNRPLMNHPNLRVVNGRYYSIFPKGVALLCAGPVWVCEQVLRIAFDRNLGAELIGARPYAMERKMAAFFVGLAAVALFFAARKRLADLPAAAAALTLCFATSAWTSGGIGLWQHGPLLMLYGVMMWLLLSESTRPAIVAGCGATLGLAYLVRPTSALVILLMGFYYLRKLRWRACWYGVGVGLILVPFVVINIATYGHLLPPYYDVGRLGTNPQFFEAITANLVSPSRGIFIFSPVLLWAGVGGWYRWSDGDWDLLDTVLLCAMGLHLLAISSFKHWWGGYSLGPRFMTDLLGFLVYFMFPVFDRIFKRGWPAWRTALFAATLLFSIGVQARMANADGPSSWCSLPVSIDQQPERLWDWTDPQFLRK